MHVTIPDGMYDLRERGESFSWRKLTNLSNLVPVDSSCGVDFVHIYQGGAVCVLRKTQQVRLPIPNREIGFLHLGFLWSILDAFQWRGKMCGEEKSSWSFSPLDRMLNTLMALCTLNCWGFRIASVPHPCSVEELGPKFCPPISILSLEDGGARHKRVPTLNLLCLYVYTPRGLLKSCIAQGLKVAYHCSIVSKVTYHCSIVANNVLM